ncbi:MAG: copper resistance CopC family protein [Nakamurella sp.]
MTTPTPAARCGHSGSRLLPRLLVLLVLTLAAGVGLAGPAAAHNVLISSDPTDGSTLQTAPTSVRLTFDQPVQNFQPVVTIIGPDGQRYESGSPQIDSTVVTTNVAALPVAGAYSIAYRIVSADGHPVEGSIAFQLAEGAVSAGAVASGAVASGAVASAVPSGVTPPAGSSSTASAGAAAGPAQLTTSSAAAPAASSSGLTGWVWAAIAIAAILVIVAIAVILRRPKQPE